jgi:hypothetical protein
MAYFFSFALLLIAAPAVAAEVILAAPGTDGWRALEFSSIARHTRYEVTTSDGVVGVKAISNCSASALYLPTDTVDLKATPRLRWRWKIEKGIDVADERLKAGDDFAVRVYVMFQFDPAHASLWERARHALGTQLYGDLVPGHALNYVWSTHEPTGAAWDNPFSSASKMVSLGRGPLPEWTDAVVDVAGDYVKFFGHATPPVLAVALMTDSDNSCQSAIAEYADFRFVGRQ